MNYSPKASAQVLKDIAMTLPSDSRGVKALQDGIEALEYMEQSKSVANKPSGKVTNILASLGLGKE